MSARSRAAAAPTHLWLTDDEAACRLLAERPEALLIGFILDQQVTVQKAFRGPLDLQERVGTIEPAGLAAMPLEQLERAFADKPALHRYPVAMAGRVREAMQLVVEQYGGDAGAIWRGATDLDELRSRLKALPGFGDAKIFSVVAVLARRFGVAVTGWEQGLPAYGTLGDVESLEDLAEYQRRKRAVKKARREAEAAKAATPAKSTRAAKVPRAQKP